MKTELRRPMTNNELFEQTREILHENMIKVDREDGNNFHYTKPSPSRYPYQFFWDTCFHVFILVSLQEEDMAKEHLRSLFQMQEDDGFVGHMIYWDRLKPGRMTDFFQTRPRFRHFYKSHMSSLIQPPIVAQAVARVYEASGEKSFLREMLPKLKKYYRWLARNRDFDGDKLLSIISPFESGMDWKPTYDVALGRNPGKANWRLFAKVVGVDIWNFSRDYDLDKIARNGPFRVKDTGFNTMYIQNLTTLAELCESEGDGDAGEFRELAIQVTNSMVEVMYDEENAAFLDVYGKENIKIDILTPTAMYPVVLRGISEEMADEVINRHFFKGEEFDTPFPLPSVAKNESSFDPNQSIYIWRGPTWVVHNWFLNEFFLRKGHFKEADRLIDSVRKLIEKSGFREYYHPFTGEGLGAEDFTWPGLVTDMIRAREKMEKT